MSANASYDSHHAHVPLMDGTNYIQWKVQMQNFLQSKGLGKFITERGKQLLENPLLSAEKKSVLEDNDEMALGQIKVNIATSYSKPGMPCRLSLKVRRLSTRCISWNNFGKADSKNLAT